MRISQKMLKERMRHYLAVLEAEEDSPWIHPGSASDVLFPASLRHKHHREYKHASCRCYSCYRSEDPVCDTALKEDCDSVGCSGPTIPRKRLAVKGPDPAIHIGNIACADVVMKSGTHRDELAKEEGIIGFEMESAGVAGVFPCVVVKGVCDYADSHKNERWQDYAAGTAACCVKAFLELWSSSSSSSSSQPQPRGPLHQASSPEYESNWELLPERPIKLLTAGSREGSGYGHLDHEVSKYRERI
ncbi:nucleoside phosphorylase domain-containing protein [Aspergillus karnatakaensis]|uniref:nucleoside phosphorylase domain-containing protein n=1 Tax=Aspergillus karnatakaensis TaxID=1810916 RepID=UPI003CCD66A8